MDFTPSKYQTAIFQHTQKMFSGQLDRNLAVVARAGTGKTTTIVKALDYVPAGLNSVFCAFNKSIQLELATRLPKHIESRTFHSLGFANLKQVNPKMAVDTWKAHDIFEHLIPKPDKYSPQDEKQQWKEFQSNFIKAFGFARNNLINFNDEAEVWELMEALDLDGFEPRIATILPEAHQLDMNNTDEVDFDDMISLPLYLHLPLRQFHFLAGDEVQDLNNAQIELTLQSIQKGLFAGIGDPKQGIYQFRGADEYAMDKLIEATNAEVLPLPITYRCPLLVVKLANILVPDLEPREGAPDGIVEEITEMKMHQIAQPGDMILCRINAPLAEMAFSFIRRGVKATIMGRDVGKQLASIAQKAISHAQKMPDVYAWLFDQRQKEVEKVRNNPYNRSPQAKIARINDKYDTLTAIADNCTSPYEFPGKTQNLFDDKADGIVLSTVHKAKGMEAHRVFILRPDLLPHPLAKSEAALQQERNLTYVAVTRSKSELYFVGQMPYILNGGNNAPII
jgi:ATP-dependent DNA helicase UvrD/PcrA